MGQLDDPGVAGCRNLALVHQQAHAGRAGRAGSRAGVGGLRLRCGCLPRGACGTDLSLAGARLSAQGFDLMGKAIGAGAGLIAAGQRHVVSQLVQAAGLPKGGVALG